MVKKLFLLVCSTFVFFSCSKKEVNSKESTVRINISSEPDSLHPWISATADTRSIFMNVFEGLLKICSDGSLKPAIAESYNISKDKLKYSFKLKKNIIFHNGKKLTSKDVLHTYNSFTGLDGSKPISNKFKSVKSISAPDDYSFEVELFHRDSSFLDMNMMPILPEGYAEQENKPIGTGPYKFVSYLPGQKIVFKRNENYYDKENCGKVDNIEVFFMNDVTLVTSALKSNQLDIAYFIYASDASLLEKEFNVVSSAQNMVQLFALNNTYGPLKDLKVRQAINMAVNKKDIINGVWSSFADEVFSNFSPALKTYYNDSLKNYYKFNIEKAKKLLKEAGYENGFDLTITVPSNYIPHVQTAEILVSQLEKINIHCNIKPVEWANWMAEVYGKANYQSTVIAFTGKSEPHDILVKYASDNYRNFIRFNSAEYDKLIEQATSETDINKRISIYKNCQRLITENAASVYICDPKLIVATKKNLHGYNFYPISFIDFSTWYYE